MGIRKTAWTVALSVEIPVNGAADKEVARALAVAKAEEAGFHVLGEGITLPVILSFPVRNSS